MPGTRKSASVGIVITLYQLNKNTETHAEGNQEGRRSYTKRHTALYISKQKERYKYISISYTKVTYENKVIKWSNKFLK